MQIDHFFVKKSKSTKNSKKKSKPKSLGKTSKVSQEFPTLDEFKQQLCSWKPLLKNILNHFTFTNIHTAVQKKYAKGTCYPPPELIFNAFKLSHLDKLKVVIVGQDPYIRDNQAMGLCFSVPMGVRPPPSLVNMYKCIENDPNIQGSHHLTNLCTINY